MGSLLVGERFDIGEFHTPAVLLREGRVLASSVPRIPPRDLERALRACRVEAECSLRLGGRNYLSIPATGISFGEGYTLRTLEDIDAASATINKVIRQVFIGASAAAIGAALLFSLLSAGSIVKPIAAIVTHLQESERTGMLPLFKGELSRIREIRELTSGFNNAAAAIREARENLESAYIEFVGSLAHALDARDRYTAGHSHRVSELACAIGTELGFTPSDLEQIRVGALLHDIGKIGIADRVLQKPTRLTEEEFAMVKEHPEIGKRILERVHGFAPYLDAVQFHHENWDGTGYPSGRHGTETPIEARIIHVVDAYDAMTTDRPYRRGMSHKTATTNIAENAGTQFDPRIVAAFLNVIEQFRTETEPEYAGVA
jgi:putative nucleotidyltransferase with HDIG domain